MLDKIINKLLLFARSMHTMLM